MNDAASPEEGFDRLYAEEQIRRSRHPLRRLVKGFYLRETLREVQGPTVDFGCGAGQLLARLPKDSLGLEVNPHLITALHSQGLSVQQSHGTMVDFELRNLPSGRFRSLVIAHVLEHLPDPAAALSVLLASCRRLGIQRVVVIVPGSKGFASDATHRTFIDAAWVKANLPARLGGFSFLPPSYFPGPWAWVGRYFVFHEMKLVFDRDMSHD